MKKDSNKDNLEEFFRQHLRNSEAAENGWNVPPDNIWEDVQPQIKINTRTVKFKYFGKWFPLLLLGVGIIISVLVQSSLHQKEVDRLSTEINSIKTELSYISSQLSSSDMEATFHAGEIKSSTPQVFIQPDPGRNKATKIEVLDKLLPTSEDHNASDAQPGALTNQLYKSINQPKSQRSEDIDKMERLPGRLPTQPLKPLDLKDNQHLDLDATAPLPTVAFSELRYQDTLVATTRTVRTKMAPERPAIKFSLGPMLANRFLDTIPEYFETNVNHQYKGFSLGFNLEWPIYRRWHLETGINYYHIGAESHHHHHFHYSEAEQDAPGLSPNDFQFQRRFHSAIGHIGTTLVLTRAQPNSTPNENIDISFDSDTHAHYLGVPLALKYKVRMGRLGFSLQGGVLGSIQFHQKFVLKHFASDDPEILFKHFENNSNVDEVKKFHLQYLIGAGLDFHLSPYYALHFEPTFSRSLTPLTTIEGVRVGLQAIHIRGGLKLYF